MMVLLSFILKYPVKHVLTIRCYSVCQVLDLQAGSLILFTYNAFAILNISGTLKIQDFMVSKEHIMR